MIIGVVYVNSEGVRVEEKERLFEVVLVWVVGNELQCCVGIRE